MRFNFSAHHLVNLLGNKRMKVHSDCTEIHAQIIFLDSEIWVFEIWVLRVCYQCFDCFPLELKCKKWFFLHALQEILRALVSYPSEDRFLTEFQRKYISEITESIWQLVVSNHRHSDLKMNRALHSNSQVMFIQLYKNTFTGRLSSTASLTSTMACKDSSSKLLCIQEHCRYQFPFYPRCFPPKIWGVKITRHYQTTSHLIKAFPWLIASSVLSELCKNEEEVSW